MASPYTPQSIVGYNPSPPADDGSQIASNRITWAGVKTELNDPIKTLAEAIDTAITAGFGKVLGGVGVTSTAISYTVLSSDQGKLVRATASGVTITTPDATDVLSPFVFAVLNNSSGTITFDGNGSQTIDGNTDVTIAAGSGMVVFTDGTNWYTTGQQGTLTGKQMMYADIVNGTLAESNSSNAVTFSLKTLAGTDPSSADPIQVCFRSATLTSGIYVYRNITSATSLTISAGSNLGVSTNSQPFRVWIVLFDDSGTVRMGVIQCRSGTNIYPLGRHKRASSSTETGGNGDSAQVFYTGSAVTDKPYIILGYANYEAGQSTAGNWSVSPGVIQLYGHAEPLPGQHIQQAGNQDGAVASGSTTIPWDDTIPLVSEGTQFMSQAITPVSGANVLLVEHIGLYAINSGGAHHTAALFQDGGTCLAALAMTTQASNSNGIIQLSHRVIAGTTSSTTFTVRAGPSTASTITFNGSNTSRKFGGVSDSVLNVTEVVA